MTPKAPTTIKNKQQSGFHQLKKLFEPLSTSNEKKWQNTIANCISDNRPEFRLHKELLQINN